MFTGYAIEKENREAVLAAAVDPTQLLRAIDTPIPDRIDADWSRMENQANMNSCGGHASSTVGEAIRKYLTGDAKYQFSRMYAYRTGQLESGIRGDNGVTIEGAVKAAKKHGFISEDLLPYPKAYATHVPQELFEEGKKVVAVQDFRIHDEDQACEIIARGGGIIAGIPWLESFSREMDADMTGIGGRTLGGHAVAFISYESRGPERWPQLTNSHGNQWAKAGRSYVSPKVFRWMLANGTLVGLVGLTGVRSTPIDWTQENIFLAQ